MSYNQILAELKIYPPLNVYMDLEKIKRFLIKSKNLSDDEIENLLEEVISNEEKILRCNSKKCEGTHKLIKVDDKYCLVPIQ